MKHQDAILAPGAGFPLIRSLLNLNKKAGTQKAEVVIMSRNDPATSLRMFESIKHYGLDIGRAALAGRPCMQYGSPVAATSSSRSTMSPEAASVPWTHTPLSVGASEPVTAASVPGC